jgi:hypothetical protein
MLRLVDLIVGVGHIESRSGGLDVQMNRVRTTRSEVDSIEERQLVARVVERFELRRIEKPIRPQAGHREEVANRVRPGAETDVTRRAVERSVSERCAAGRLGLIETRFGHDVDNQTALVAVFGRSNSCDDFHRLHGILRNLIRVQPALLVRDRLVVNRKLGLRVIANWMEEAVRV